MRYCQNCGSALPEDARFCGKCGSKVESSNPSELSPSVVNPPQKSKRSGSNSKKDSRKKPPKKIKKKEEKKKNSSLQTVLLFFSIIVGILVLGIGTLVAYNTERVNESFNKPIETAEGEAVTPGYASDLKKKEYTEVVKIFEGRGFTNITVLPVEMEYSVFGTAKHDNYTLEYLSIGDNSEYERGETVAADTPVVIRYYIRTGSPYSGEGALTPTVSSELAGKAREKVIEIFRSRGFTNIRTETVYSAKNEPDTVKTIYVNGTDQYSSTVLVDPETPVVIYVCADPNASITPPEGMAVTPAGSNDMSGSNYITVEQIFRRRGFTNVKKVAMGDLILGIFSSDGEVEDVSVNGNTSYMPGQTVPADTPVIIRYHSFSDDPSIQDDVTIPDFVGMTMKEARKAADNAGITVSNWTYHQTVIQSKEGWDRAKKVCSDEHWTVVAQSTVGTRKVELTIELISINTENNAEFYALLNEAVDENDETDYSKEFADKFKGKLVEFTGTIAVVEQVSTYNFTFWIFGFNDERHVVKALFCFYDMDFHYVRNSTSTEVFNKIQNNSSSFYRVVGIVDDYDTTNGIHLIPISIEYVGPMNN